MQIALKKAQTFMLDILLLKDATAAFKEVEWERALEIEYEALLANGTWELDNVLTYQQVLTEN